MNQTSYSAWAKKKSQFNRKLKKRKFEARCFSSFFENLFIFSFSSKCVQKKKIKNKINSHLKLLLTSIKISKKFFFLWTYLFLTQIIRQTSKNILFFLQLFFTCSHVRYLYFIYFENFTIKKLKQNILIPNLSIFIQKIYFKNNLEFRKAKTKEEKFSLTI